ncbi:ATP-binding protein [Streptomyces sp. H10-C2]|uniref:ATP-binding protein n=1 Tax=unclassified Streptomyces TaxID=2593676 RepID=UPI0024B88248|nr:MULTISPECIES: ATP-binding protein [unclassified Streptomyces]MDJ0342702.1 ATP-binding protein [Streptomyces sp. PH10-H1]MDJ0372589.1 ATP-binding protein [Streptomyces sp. H10-C2]
MKQQPGALGRNAVPGIVPTAAAPAAATAPTPLPGPACRTFPGSPAHVSAARRYVTQVLIDPDYRRVVDDAVLLVSELASNAILHTRSGDPGGGFTVELAFPADMLRIAVHDQGSREFPRVLHGTGEGGRGLGLVDVLATDWGITGTPAGRTVWFELTLRP